MFPSRPNKTIKLWRLYSKNIVMDYPSSMDMETGELSIPPVSDFPAQSIKTASLKRVFKNAHQYNINSVSVSQDGETFLSADDLRVNLWHVDRCHDVYNVLDAKPQDLKELNEVITSCNFHPSLSHTFVYGSSRGNIRIVDLRQRALADRHVMEFKNSGPKDGIDNDIFGDIMMAVSDVRFNSNGRYIVSRDYLTLKIWDMAKADRPIASVPVHDYLVPFLPELYDNDCIFDKFQCHSNADGTRFITGSYNNNYLLYDAVSGTSTVIEAKDDPGDTSSGTVPENPNVDLMDFAKKALHVRWHPYEDVLAVAGMNKIYIYQAARKVPYP